MTENMQERESKQSHGRFKWAVLALAVIFGAVYMAGHFGWEIPEPEGYPAATTGSFKGFYQGKRGPDGSLFFVFFDHPNLGLAPLYDYRTLHSDVIKLAIYAPDLKSLELELETWRIEENETSTRTWDHRLQTIPLDVQPGFEITELKLPMSFERREVSLRYRGLEVWRGQHRTQLSYRPADAQTLGERAWDRVLYIVGGILVAFTSIKVTGMLIARVKIVPEIPPWQALLALIVGGTVLLMGARWYIMTVALRSAVLTYLPVAVSAFFFAVHILRPTYAKWFFIKLYDLDEIPSVEIWIYEVLQQGNEILVATGYTWGMFFTRQKNRMKITAQERQPTWYFTVPGNSAWRLYYIEEVQDDRWGTHVRLTGQHQKKIEEYKADLVAQEDLSKALTAATLQLTRTRADMRKMAIEEGAKMAQEYIDKLLVALKMREEKNEPKKDES